MSPFSLHHGDCIDILKQLPDTSVDMVLTDPPYVEGMRMSGFHAASA